jgi:hypothetical protein
MRYATEKALWRSVVEVKHGGGGWCSNEVSRTYGVGMWTNIRRGWEVFSRLVRFEVRDGFKIRFW